ncbi:hypothetical protein [Priestia flexa]|uniref:hypothetical protein n=1 Tax=Priestia flexa TaxID=86664 RepID=UPI00099D3A7A|nr:hypothetical protein [Priestia flexa]AQX56119.1 hypothetical protein BC359_18705 [Priestia flexa]
MSHKTCIKLLNVVNPHFPDATPFINNKEIEYIYEKKSSTEIKYESLSIDNVVLYTFDFESQEGNLDNLKSYCVLQNKSAEYCKLICRCYFTWSGGHDSLSWQSQPLILLASWLETHARRGSMSSCNIV